MYNEIESSLLPCKSVNGNIFGIIYRPKNFEGKLATVIISHGFNVNCTDDIALLLAKCGYAVYIFDFCGGSASTRSDMKLEDMTVLTEKDDLKAVFNTVSALPYVDSDNIFLYGESLGGFVSAITGVELKDKIAGIILSYPAFTVLSDMAVKYASLEEAPQKITLLGKNLNRTFAEVVFGFMPEGYGAVESLDDRLAVTQKFYKYISQIEGKIVIFHGTEDRLVDIAFSREAIKYLKNAKLFEIVGSGHGFAQQALSTVAEKIDSFIIDNRR